MYINIGHPVGLFSSRFKTRFAPIYYHYVCISETGWHNLPMKNSSQYWFPHICVKHDVYPYITSVCKYRTLFKATDPARKRIPSCTVTEWESASSFDPSGKDLLRYPSKPVRKFSASPVWNTSRYCSMLIYTWGVDNFMASHFFSQFGLIKTACSCTPEILTQIW